MRGEVLKAHLEKIASEVDESTDLEDVYAQLALLSDIEQSEKEVEQGDYLTHDEVEAKAKEWLR